MNAIAIRRALSPEDFRACQEAQRRAWGIVAEGYLIPIATMAGAAHHCGLVLGAFLSSGEAVGVSFAFLGKSAGTLCLYSQLTGVVPDHQSQGLGLRLKQAQWEYARAQGLDLLVWAFDPLQSGNARFNLEKLGATAVEYLEDMYGPRTDTINAHASATDRLIAHWRTDQEPGSRLPLDRAQWSKAPRLIDPSEQSIQTLAIGSLAVSPRVLIEIPASIGDLRTRAPEVAEAWEIAVRRAFQAAFGHGFRAIGFARDDSVIGDGCFYLLER